MIIWINGAFGAGKSTVAELLHEKIPESYLYDPENVGAFIWDNSPDSLSRKGDFQDIPLWRSMNYEMLKYLDANYKGALIVPMTLTNPQYYDEVVGRLERDGIVVKSFILTASRETLVSRLRGRGEEENGWGEQQIDRCLTAFVSGTIPGKQILTDDRSVDEVAKAILQTLQPYEGEI